MTKIFIFCCLIFCSDLRAQEISVPETASDTISNQPGVTQADTVFISVPETLTVTKTRVDTVTQLLRAKRSEKIDAVEFWKKINFYTIINIIIFLLLGYLSTRIFYFLRVRIIASRHTIIQNILAFIQMLIWIFIFYLIIDTLFSVSDLILLLIFLSIFLLIGFAAIPLIKNILGGFYLLIKKPFRNGSYINILNIQGVVTTIEWRATSLVNEDGKITKIPNNQFLNVPFEIIDSYRKDKEIELFFSFPAALETSAIMEVLRESAISSPFAYSKRAPQVFLMETDHLNKINRFKLNVWIFDSRYENELISSINRFVFDKIYQSTSPRI